MENTTKALLIGGSIMVSVLVIAIGMFIYANTQGSIAGGMQQLSAQEIEAFNSQWNTYVGKQNGAIINSLIMRLVINATKNQEESIKLVGLDIETTPDASNHYDVMPEATDLKTEDFQTLKSTVQLRHTYNVSVDFNGKTGLVNKIVVKY